MKLTTDVLQKIMTLSIKDYAIIKVIQSSHCHDDVRYGTSSGIQCTFMSPISETEQSLDLLVIRIGLIYIAY